MATITTERIPGNPAIAVDRAGSGELLVFLHGIGGNRTNWTEQIEHFGEHFHALAWDARGYGLSDDYDGPLDFADFSRDLARLIDHYGVERAHLVGLSMGGRIAQDFYARYPDRVSTLVLVATFTGFKHFSEAERRQFVELRRRPLLEGKEPKDIAPVVARTLAGPRATEAQFARLVASMAALHKVSYLKTIESTTMYDAEPDLEALAVPTLLVFGADDGLTRADLGRQMASRIRGAELVVVEHAGHLVNIEAPEAFDDAVLPFLLKHRRRVPS